LVAATLGLGSIQTASFASSAHAKAESTPVLTWLSAEEWGDASGAKESAAPTAKLPASFRVELSSGRVVESAELAAPLDPPGGGDATWNIIEYNFHDLAGRSAPVRLGNGSLGYTHYANAHNLYAFEPLHASLQTHTPAVTSGAHLEYLAYLTTSPGGPIFATVRNVVQNAKTTSDGKYTATDGYNIGTITAYCDKTSGNVCPNAVDDNATY